MTGRDDLNDDLSDLIGSPIAKPVTLPETYKPRDFSEPCRKCGGSGYWRPGYPCFACKGHGKRTFKTSPETRAAARVSATNRKAKSAAGNLEFFKSEQPEIFAWIDGNDFPFAVSMREAIEKWGNLTPNQMAACHRCIEKLNAAKKAAAERTAAAPVADAAGVDRLKAAFDKAAAFTASKQTDTGMPLRLRSPKITIGTMTITPAKATSANAGALYVKDSGEYMGKIKDGKFFTSRECTDEQRARILSFIADPKAAAEAYGKETGICCVCNATLTSKWRLAGIGPICSQKFGW